MGAATGPAYLRVLEDLRSRIRSGALEPGARVPSRNAIIASYGVGETAAKHALRVLLAEGLIVARPGSGCYVRREPAPDVLERDRPRSPGSPFGVPGGAGGDRGGRARRLAREHQTSRAPAPPWVAARLGVAAGSAATVTRYLMSADGRPVQLAVSYEPAALTARTPVELPEEGPLAGRGVIERMASVGIVVDEVTEEVGTRAAAPDEAAALGIAAGAVLLVVEREHRAAGRAVEVGQVLVPAGAFRLRYRFPVRPA